MTPKRSENKESGYDTRAAGQMAKAANSPFRPALHFTDVFVGRGHELKELSEALEDARNGSPGIVMLVGEAGIGKTRTAQEFATHAERERINRNMSDGLAFGRLPGQEPKGLRLARLRVARSRFASCTCRSVDGADRLPL